MLHGLQIIYRSDHIDDDEDDDAFTDIYSETSYENGVRMLIKFYDQRGNMTEEHILT